MAELSQRENNNKKRFYALLFEAFISFVVKAQQAALIAEEQVADNERALRKDPSPQTSFPSNNLDYLATVRSLPVATFPVLAAVTTVNAGGDLKGALRSVSDHIAGLIDADDTITKAHKPLHKQAIKAAFCVNNPTELLHRLQRMYEALYEMRPMATREERDEYVEHYLASYGEVNSAGESTMVGFAAVPELRQQLQDDFYAVLDKPKPQSPQVKVDQMQSEDFIDLLRLSLRFNYFQQVTALLNKPAVVSKPKFIAESTHIARTVLVNNSLRSLLNVTPQLVMQANRFSQWMYLFNNSPYAQSLRPACGFNGHDVERSSKFHF